MTNISDRAAYKALAKCLEQLASSNLDGKDRALLQSMADFCMFDFRNIESRLIKYRVEAGLPPDYLTMLKVEQMIEWALEIGAATTSAEARKALLKGEQARRGKASGEARAAYADETWKRDALIAARVICGEGAITQDGLADRMLGNWPAGKWMPEKGTLVIQIGIWEKDEGLPRRKPRRKASHNRVRKVKATG